MTRLLSALLRIFGTAGMLTLACDSPSAPVDEQPVIIWPAGPPRAGSCPPSDPRNGVVFPCSRGGVVHLAGDTARR